MSSAWQRSPLVDRVVVIGVALLLTQLGSIYVLVHRVGVDRWVWKSTVVIAAITTIVATKSLVKTRPVPGNRPAYRPVTAITSAVSATTAAGLCAAPVVLLASFAFGAGEAAAPAQDATTLDRWASLAETAVFAPFVEEALFRVVLLGLLLRVVSARPALLLQAVVFAIAHTAATYGLVGFDVVASPHNITAAIAVAFSGILYGYLTLEFRSVWPAIFLHSLNNAVIETGYWVPWVPFVVYGALFFVTVLALFRGMFGLVTSLDPLKGTESRFITWLYPRASLLTAGRSPELQRLREWTDPLLPDQWRSRSAEPI